MNAAYASLWAGRRSGVRPSRYTVYERGEPCGGAENPYGSALFHSPGDHG
ncbi:MAG: hypothetical protein IPJ65_04895 [Archangiaceae bacterium]|nr:hypothetical protein [Archangiaceae bacterium]